MFRRITISPSLVAPAFRIRTYAAQPSARPKSRYQTHPPPSASPAQPSAADAESSSATQPTHYRITLLRSAIGLPPYAQETLSALGLKKRLQHVYHPFSATCAGQILRVKELVKVENVNADQVMTPEEERRMRKPGSGFSVLGRQRMAWNLKDESVSETTTAEPGHKPSANSAHPTPSATTGPQGPLGVRSFHTSSISRAESLESRHGQSDRVAPVFVGELSELHTHPALAYLETFTPESIRRSDCEVEFSRSSGPGGQNVNKLNTKATLRFSLRKPFPPWFPSWCVEGPNGLQSCREYVASSHSILITSTATRSQASNVEDCFRKLHALIDGHARRALVPLQDPTKKKRVTELQKKEQARRRVMKDKQKSIKASRRGDR